MQSLIFVLCFAAVALADVSHLFSKPTNNLLSPYTPKRYNQPVFPKFVPKSQPQYDYQGHHGPQIAIVRQIQENRHDGYQWGYETANGISAHEEAQLRNAGPDQVAKSAAGAFQYTAPDGTPIQVSYVADENGFQPQGAHLPTPPPIPPAILRSLKWIADHPPRQEKVAYGN